MFKRPGKQVMLNLSKVTSVRLVIPEGTPMTKSETTDHPICYIECTTPENRKEIVPFNFLKEAEAEMKTIQQKLDNVESVHKKIEHIHLA